MAILGNFEITVLTPTVIVSNITGLLEQQWQPLTEYPAPGGDEFSAMHCQKFIALPSPAPVPASPTSIDDAAEENYVHTLETTEDLLEFAIDYKVQCGFSFVDPDEASLIVFRTYLDGKRIGSGFVKRERWERNGTYRLRKYGKRIWVDNSWSGQWLRQKWTFDRGRHGTLKIEVWRETDNPTSSSHGRLFQAPRPRNSFVAHELFEDGRTTIDLTGVDDDLSPLEGASNTPRVRRTRRVDMWPMATFVFEYRTEETLRTLGVIPTAAHDGSEGEAAEQTRRRTSKSPTRALEESKLPLSPLTSPSRINQQQYLPEQDEFSPHWHDDMGTSVSNALTPCTLVSAKFGAMVGNPHHYDSDP